MAITLRQLYKNAKAAYDMKLVSGESNMENIVQWVHMLEDPETAGFIHGQELIFTTGIGSENTKWLLSFVKNLKKHQASGLVLNIGPYIKSVPKELILYCKEIEFPLFTVPWEIRLVDISHDFCHKIVANEENELSVAGAFRNAIFCPEELNLYRPILERKEYDLEADFCVAALSFQIVVENKYVEYEKMVRLHLHKLLLRKSERYSIFKQDKDLVVVMQNFTNQEIEDAMERLRTICSNEASTFKLFVGISENEAGISSLAKNYKRAVAVLTMAEKQNKSILSYRSIGLYKLCIELEDTTVLKNMYDDTLGKLVDYDEKNQTDYVKTLMVYLNNNASVQEVARLTYVHRNTINYKIKKIKDILKCELTYEDGLKLMFAFYSMDVL